jgi:hypothetical protein
MFYRLKFSEKMHVSSGAGAPFGEIKITIKAKITPK